MASLNTMPMIPCRIALRNSKSTKNSTSQPPSGRSRKAQNDFIFRNGPSRYSVSIRFFSGHSVTRLANFSRKTLKEITRSASITSPSGMGRRAVMRAAEFQGRNSG